MLFINTYVLNYVEEQDDEYKVYLRSGGGIFIIPDSCEWINGHTLLLV